MAEAAELSGPFRTLTWQASADYYGISSKAMAESLLMYEEESGPNTNTTRALTLMTMWMNLCLRAYVHFQ